MNLVALLACLLPWAPTPLSAFVRVYLACSLLSIEMQVVTWWNLGTLPDLVPWNLGLAACGVAAQLWLGSPAWRWVAPTLRVVPAPALAVIIVLVAALNLWLPLEAADAYQLDRVAQIERLGTLGYDVAANPKVNITGAFYELMVADLRQLAGVGPGLVRVHGLIGLGLYVLALAAIAPWLGDPISAWGRVALLVVPTVFHQMVLIKNDLFLGMAGLVALAWATLGTDDPRSNWRHALGAAWLVGLAVGSKQVHAPLVVALALALVLRASKPGTSMALAFAGGGVIGGLCAGLLLTLAQNAQVYGDIFASGPVSQMENLNTSPAAAAESLFRLLLGLGDLGQLTPILWPNRGGWGGTLGLPFLWALAVVAADARHGVRSRRVLACALVHMALFGAFFPDADLSQRILLGPGLLVVAAGVHTTRAPAWARATLTPAILLSAAQILRSAALYSLRP